MMEQRRLHKTLVDYMVIAISPALIMLLVGSLCFFLLTALYHGEHHFRLSWVFGFFILGAVMVGRLSIEEGKEYAMLFALPLAAAVSVAVMVLFQLNPLACLTLVALIWYAAHKLTWDCTVVNDRDDASGEGLLQHIGLDQRPDESKDEAAATPPSSQQTITNWWQQYLARRKRSHTPGVWVVYFSLVALPMFGFGQLLIPSDDTASRNYAFRLLMVFVASALLLLLTTSFLGLRRYLRQRSMEMPLEMAGTWLTLGGCLIVGLLGFCLLLPRPGPNGALSEAIAKVGSPADLMNSRFGFGKGELDEDQATRTRDDQEAFGEGAPSQRSDPQSQSPAHHDNASETTSGQQQSNNSQSNNSQSNQNPNESANDGQSSDESSSNSDSQEQSSSDNQGDGQTSPPPSGNESNQSPEPQNRPTENAASPDSPPPPRNEQQERQQLENQDNASPPRSSQQQRGREQSSPEQARSPESQARRPKPSPNLPSWSELSPLVMLLFKLVLWACMAAVAGYLLYKNWDKIVAAWHKFRRELAEFWQRWFGQTGAGADVELATATELRSDRPFASFHDPFANGATTHESPAAVVRYSFEALEAWGREHGLPRSDEQTPHEFAQQIAPQAPHMAAETMQLADLYNQAAYAGAAMPDTTLPQLRAFWQKLAGAPSAVTVG